MSEKRKPTANDVFTALEKRFPAPAWALLREVGNATGSRCNRHADAVAVSLWPSRGLEIHGVEIKVSRSDWLNELKQPSKADAIQRYCDRWWIAAPKGIIETAELPPAWGLLELRGGSLRATVDAPKLEPQALSRSFVAAVIRRAHEGLDRTVAAARSEGYAKGVESAPAEKYREHDLIKSQLASLRSSVEEFEAASGLSIRGWGAGRMGEAVKRVMYLRENDPTEELRTAAERLREHAKRLELDADATTKARQVILAGSEAAE